MTTMSFSCTPSPSFEGIGVGDHPPCDYRSHNRSHRSYNSHTTTSWTRSSSTWTGDNAAHPWWNETRRVALLSPQPWWAESGQHPHLATTEIWGGEICRVPDGCEGAGAVLHPVALGWSLGFQGGVGGTLHL